MKGPKSRPKSTMKTYALPSVIKSHIFEGRTSFPMGAWKVHLRHWLSDRIYQEMIADWENFIIRLATLSSSPTRRMMCTSHSSMKSGAPPIRGINVSTRRTRTLLGRGPSISSSVSMLAVTSAVWPK